MVTAMTTMKTMTAEVNNINNSNNIDTDNDEDVEHDTKVFSNKGDYGDKKKKKNDEDDIGYKRSVQQHISTDLKSQLFPFYFIS